MYGYLADRMIYPITRCPAFNSGFQGHRFIASNRPVANGVRERIS